MHKLILKLISINTHKKLWSGCRLSFGCFVVGYWLYDTTKNCAARVTSSRPHNQQMCFQYFTLMPNLNLKTKVKLKRDANRKSGSEEERRQLCSFRSNNNTNTWDIRRNRVCIRGRTKSLLSDAFAEKHTEHTGRWATASSESRVPRFLYLTKAFKRVLKGFGSHKQQQHTRGSFSGDHKTQSRFYSARCYLSFVPDDHKTAAGVCSVSVADRLPFGDLDGCQGHSFSNEVKPVGLGLLPGCSLRLRSRFSFHLQTSTNRLCRCSGGWREEALLRGGTLHLRHLSKRLRNEALSLDQ